MLAAQPAVVGSGGSGGNSGGDISTAMARVRTCEFVSELSRLTTTTTEYFIHFFSPPFFTLLFIMYNTLSQSGIGFANRGEPMAVNVGHLASARTLPVLVWLQLWRLLHCFYYLQQITRQRNADVCRCYSS